jgi:hypothetical protein
MRARGSVDRASGSGPEDRGFESLRAHKSKSSKHLMFAAFCNREKLIRSHRSVHPIYPVHPSHKYRHNHQYVCHQ